MKHSPTESLARRSTSSGAVVVLLKVIAAVAGAAAVAVLLIGLPQAGAPAGISVANAADGNKTNSCGCYRDSSGSCYCGKKTKCGCPGDCEPKGCEEKRNKQIEKEIEVETRKAQEQSRKHAEAKPSSRSVAEPAEVERPTTHAKAKRPTVKMTAPQRKEFVRLLDIYLAEDPDHHAQTLDQARSTVKASGSRD